MNESAIIALWAAGKPADGISAELGLRWATVWNVLRKERSKGNRLAARRPSRKRIIVRVPVDIRDFDEMQRLVADVRHDLPDWSLPEQAALCLEEGLQALLEDARVVP